MWGQHGWHSTLGAWAWPCGALSKCFRVSLDSLPQGQPTKQERSSSTSFSLLSEGSLPNLLFLPFYWFIYLPTLSIKHAHNIYWMVTLLSTLRAFLSLIFSITLRQTQPGHSLRIKQLAAGIDFMRGASRSLLLLSYPDSAVHFSLLWAQSTTRNLSIFHMPHLVLLGSYGCYKKYAITPF